VEPDPERDAAPVGSGASGQNSSRFASKVTSEAQVPQPLTDRTPLDEWATIIRADLGTAVESLIAAGRHILAAKTEHPGEFVAWLNARPFGVSRSQSYYLMEIAEAFGGFHMCGNLPTEISALRELARLTPAQRDAAIGAGEISPVMRHKAAKQLVARYRISDEPTVISPPENTWGTPTEFSTIVADPPWQYENTASDGAAVDHYPTMSLDQLEAIQIPAAANAHLYMWATAPLLPEAIRLMVAWGFTYKTNLVWAKTQLGMGNYVRVSHEHILLGVRGHLPIPDDRRPRSWFQADRTRHSAKPECFYDIVERSSPGPRLEMFARQPRPGWTVWGNQVDDMKGSAA
jgi:N6-adenosine-specific RNA methylase IME4